MAKSSEVHQQATPSYESLEFEVFISLTSQGTELPVGIRGIEYGERESPNCGYNRIYSLLRQFTVVHLYWSWELFVP